MSSNETKRKRGRPKSDSSLNYRFEMRVDDDMLRRLDELSILTGMTRVDIFREAFDGYEKLKKFQCQSSCESEEINYDLDYYDDDFDDTTY